MDEVKTIIIIEVVVLVVVDAMVVVVVVLLIMVVDMVIKEISKRNFINRSGTRMRKRKKKGVKIMAKRLKIYVTVVVVKVIGPVPVIHQSILLNSTKNHLKRRM